MSGVGAAASSTAVRRLRERNRLGTADIRHGRLRVELVELVHAVPPCISCRRALPRAATTARCRRWTGSHPPHAPVRRAAPHPPPPPRPPAPVRRASPDPTRPTGLPAFRAYCNGIVILRQQPAG